MCIYKLKPSSNVINGSISQINNKKYIIDDLICMCSRSSIDLLLQWFKNNDEVWCIIKIFTKPIKDAIYLDIQDFNNCHRKQYGKVCKLQDRVIKHKIEHNEGIWLHIHNFRDTNLQRYDL